MAVYVPTLVGTYCTRVGTGSMLLEYFCNMDHVDHTRTHVYACTCACTRVLSTRPTPVLVHRLLLYSCPRLTDGSVLFFYNGTQIRATSPSLFYTLIIQQLSFFC